MSGCAGRWEKHQLSYLLGSSQMSLPGCESAGFPLCGCRRTVSLSRMQLGSWSPFMSQGHTCLPPPPWLQNSQEPFTFFAFLPKPRFPPPVVYNYTNPSKRAGVAVTVLIKLCVVGSEFFPHHLPPSCFCVIRTLTNAPSNVCSTATHPTSVEH